MLPYPVKNLVKLDYCWRLNYTLWRESIYIAFPNATIYFIWANMPQVWSFTRKTFPYRSYGKVIIAATLLVNLANTAYSLAFEDYCKRSSSIYDTKKRNAQVLRQLIKETNDAEKSTVQGKANTSLSDEEILK